MIETISIKAHLLDHDAAEVAVLERTEGWILLSQDVGQLNVELVELRHFLQGKVSLVCPVSRDIPEAYGVQYLE